jgi:feruloyl esterase
MEPGHQGLMNTADWALITDRTVAACDRLDGIADGVIEDPRACRFDLAELRCTAATSTACLNAEQVDYALTLMAPLRDATGAAIDQGLAPGVRLRFEPRSTFALTLFGQVVHDDGAWDATTVNIARDLAAARRLWPELSNDNADLQPFRARGGKMLYYHGWSDPFLPALSVLAYRDAVEQRLGAGIDEVFRVFMVPGLGHCNGGTGPDEFGGVGQGTPATTADNDMLSALEAWVEHGRAPERIIAVKRESGQPKRTRPLCLFPGVAVHDGVGSPDAAESFACRQP